MKRIFVLFLSLTLVFSASACKVISRDTGSDSTNSTSNNLEESLEDILEKIYETAEVDDYFKEYINSGLQTLEITSDNCAYHLGKGDIEFESAIASEPLIMPSAYSLCLIRVKEGTDIEKVKTDIKENVDPRKWICVGVDPQNVIVDNIGDVIILIMSDDHAKALHEAFLSLKG